MVNREGQTMMGGKMLLNNQSNVGNHSPLSGRFSYKKRYSGIKK